MAVAVVIHPDRAVDVGPFGQSGDFRDAGKLLAAVVVEQLAPAPLIDKQILIPVVVVIAPYRAHTCAGSGLVQVGHAHLRGHIRKCAVVVVVVQVIGLALAAIGDVQVVPAVAVEVHNRHGRAHRGDLRHDVVEFGVQFWRRVREADAALLRHFGQGKAVPFLRGGSVHLLYALRRRARPVVLRRVFPVHHKRRDKQADDKTNGDDARRRIGRGGKFYVGILKCHER